MSRLAEARLVNDPFGDPGVLIDFRFGRGAMLFDIGDVSPLSTRELGRVSDVFVSHCHLDHFYGFDLLLRLVLHRDKTIRLFGPPGLGDAVEAKLSAYTWNLLDESSADLVVEVAEWDGHDGFVRSAFRARAAFAGSGSIGAGSSPVSCCANPTSTSKPPCSTTTFRAWPSRCRKAGASMSTRRVSKRSG